MPIIVQQACGVEEPWRYIVVSCKENMNELGLQFLKPILRSRTAARVAMAGSIKTSAQPGLDRTISNQPNGGHWFHLRAPVDRQNSERRRRRPSEVCWRT